MLKRNVKAVGFLTRNDLITYSQQIPPPPRCNPTGLCSRGSHEFNITGSFLQQWAVRLALLRGGVQWKGGGG